MASEQHVGFSPDGKLFAIINDQGILRIWDTDTNELKQEYTPSLHLTEPCTALMWVATKKSRKSLDNKFYIALGTSTGNVSLYSYAEGKVERNLKGEGHSGRVTGIVRGEADVIYTCGDDAKIISWSLSGEERLESWSCGPETPHSIAYLSKSKKLAVGSRQIKIYSTQTHELLQSFTGHTAEINLMVSFADCSEKPVEYILSTSCMERIICLWNTSKKDQNATCTLLMEDTANLLTYEIDRSNSLLKIASVTRSGVVHMYLMDLISLRSKKPIKPKVTIEIASDETAIVEPIPAIAVSLKCGNNSEELLIGYGDKRFMVFERLVPTFKEKKLVLVRSNPKKILQKKDSKIEGYVTPLKTLTPIINPDDVEYKSSIALTKKKLKSVEMPMESRLQNLNIGTPTLVGSQSKAHLLVQALHSKDIQLLNSVLHTNDAKTIDLTLQKLPVQYVGPLVNELTILMQQKRANVEYAIKWLKALVQIHSSQLMALGSADLMEKFGPCIGIIEHRVNCLKELSKLSGRLHLIVNQIKRNTEEELNTDNVLVYEDQESSDSDLEGEKTPSEGEWDEQDSEDDAEDMEVNEESDMES